MTDVSSSSVHEIPKNPTKIPSAEIRVYIDERRDRLTS